MTDKDLQHRCPACGYTETDARIQMDHHLCDEYPFFENENPIRDKIDKDPQLDRRKQQTPDHPLRRGASHSFKDSQLDEIEREMAIPRIRGSFPLLAHVGLTLEMFQPGGLYYEMRRENRLYYELLYAVESKFQEETRHQTALKYIQEREMRSGTGCPTEDGIGS